MQKEIKDTWFFNQSAHVVWEYLTKPELLEQWFTKTDLQPVTGHNFSFFDKSGKIVSCQILEAYPVTKLSYSWQAHSAVDGMPFISKVEWTLVPKEKGTELQLVHHGFAAMEDYMAHNGGWTRLGTRFAELLKTIENDSSNA